MATQISDDIEDFTNKVKEKQRHDPSTNASDSGPEFDFDWVLAAASTGAQDFIGPLTALVDFLDGAARIHPYVSVAVAPFKVLIDLELKRRTNNKKIDVLYNRMGSMMASLKPLLESDQEKINLEKLLPLLDMISKDLSECGNVLDVYKKQASIVRFILSTSWQDKLVEFAEKFIQHQRDIGLCLSVATHRATVRIETAINEVIAIVQQKSTAEVAFHQFMEANGGLERCMADDQLFAKLVKKSGAIIPNEAPAFHHPVPAYYQPSKYPPGAKYLPYSTQFVYAPQYHQPQGDVVVGGLPSPPRIRPSRRSHHMYAVSRSPTPPPPVVYGEPYYSRRSRHRPAASRSRSRSRSPMSDRRGQQYFPRRSRRSHHTTYVVAGSRSPSPMSDRRGREYSPKRSRRSRHTHVIARSRSPSPMGDRRGREYSPRRSASRSTHHSQDDNANAIAPLKMKVKSALETSLDVMIQQNTTLWTIKFTHQTQVIQSSIASSTKEILKAIERSRSGQHERLHDPQMRKIWESEKWRSSVSGPTLLEGIHDYFWQYFHDAVAQGDFSLPMWTLQFMEKPYWAALTEVLDTDQSGLVSIPEVNCFTDRKPQDLSLAVYLAISALRCSYEATYYSKVLVRLMQDIDERSNSLSVLSDPNIQTASIYAQNLQVIRSLLLVGIADPARHISDALKHNKLSDHLARVRSAHETYWEESLKKIHWEIDSPEVLDAFANDRPIEQYLLPLIFVLLRRHLLVLKTCTTLSLDPRELPSSWENICQVFNVVNARVSYLEGCFAQRKDRTAAARGFACGLFSEWQIYTVVDAVQQSLEESPQVDSSEEIPAGDLNRIHAFLRYPTGGPIPVTRPLPIAKVSTSGELLPYWQLPLNVTAICDYTGMDDKDLTFRSGDIIEVSKTSNDGWWTGRLVKDRRKRPKERLFPANLVVSSSSGPIRALPAAAY